MNKNVNKNDTRMIDVSAKKESDREAVAAACVKMSAETLATVKKKQVPKGDVFIVAQVAGMMAAKQAPGLLPLCHPLLLASTAIELSLSPRRRCIEITATVKGKGRTGFEMEALTAVSVAALTVYDMCKMLDKGMVITDIRLLKKTGGQSGTYTAK